MRCKILTSCQLPWRNYLSVIFHVLGAAFIILIFDIESHKIALISNISRLISSYSNILKWIGCLERQFRLSDRSLTDRYCIEILYSIWEVMKFFEIYLRVANSFKILLRISAFICWLFQVISWKCHSNIFIGHNNQISVTSLYKQANSDR